MKKSKRVSWATGRNLCQVKHFLQEDCPSKVGRGSQHHLQLKRSHQSIISPSFEGRSCLKQSKERLPYIPLAKWKCPPKFNLNEKWHVVAGEESKEAEDQERREKRVLEAVYPSRSAIPPNPPILSDLDQYYDDNRTPVIRIIPIEDEAYVEVSSHSTPSQNISSKLPGACLPNSPSSSVSIVTSEKLPANGKSFPPSLSTFQNPRKPPSNSPFSVRCPANEQSAPPYRSRCQKLKGSEQTQVSPKPPVSNNSVPHYLLTCKILSTPDRTEFSPDLPANQNHAPKCQTVRGNQNTSQLKSQVSGMPPTKDNPVTQFPCENPNIPQHQAKVLPKSLANHNPATQCNNQNSPKLPANGICVPQYQSNSENLGVPHGFEGGDLMVAVATAVAALAKSQEQGSLIDTDLLVKLLSNPEQIQKLMNEHGMATNPKTGPASGSNPIVPSSTTPSSTADSLDRQVTGNENRKCVIAHSTVFSRSLEVRNTNEQRGTAAMPRTKPDKVVDKAINEYQAPHAGSGPIFGPKPMAKPVPVVITKPETSVKVNLANEQGAPHVGNADIRRNKPLVHPTSDLNLEKIKKLINEYGAPKNVVNSELVPSSFPKCDVALQPELQIKSHSPNTGHASPFSSMTSPALLHKDINYYKSLIKKHGENHENVDHELLQNTNPRGNIRGGPELLKNVKPNQRNLNFQKQCAFFDRPKGCLNGSSCPFLHDTSRQGRSEGMLEASGSKRMKLSGEVTGRT
ncbi:hypothetical protein K7X08_019815 [Anisodus acutangulus]|uniref:C3H1-type domain-containing protein n=1 Tax=Anisodus acutangulus TaxID=402998 RepID=A0A9Q1MSB7_9SOLA|nr:hypothetical protein K7X08_019815 [Anisodus acutangulus]